MPKVLIKRGSKSQIDAAAAANQLTQGELYLDTTNNELCVGLSASSYARPVQSVGYPLQSGAWYSQPWLSGYASGAVTPAANTIFAIPVWFEKPTAIQKLGVHVSTAAGNNAQLALYDATGNAAGNYPGNLIANGAIATNTTGQKTINVSATLQGLYFLVWLADGAVGLRAESASTLIATGNSVIYSTPPNRHFTGSLTYGTPPSAYPASQSINSTIAQFVYFQAG